MSRTTHLQVYCGSFIMEWCTS